MWYWHLIVAETETTSVFENENRGPIPLLIFFLNHTWLCPISVVLDNYRQLAVFLYLRYSVYMQYISNQWDKKPRESRAGHVRCNLLMLHYHPVMLSPTLLVKIGDR